MNSALSFQLLDLLEKDFLFQVEVIVPTRSAWRIETSAGPRYLKRTAASRAELPFVIGLHDYLAQVAPGMVPHILRTKQGRDRLLCAGQVYLVLDCLAGREADYLKDGDPEAAAGGLALFHRVARGYRPPAPLGARRRYGTWPAQMRVRLRGLDRFRAMAEAAGGAFDLCYLALWPDYRRQGEMALACLANSGYGPLSARAAAAREICHHDLAHHNVLLHGERVRFLDLDYAVGDSVLHDLVNLANHLLRLYEWDVRPARAALLRYWGGSWPLPPILEAFRAMLIWPQDFWQIGRQYYDEKQPWSTEDFLALLARKCGQPKAILQ